VGVGGEERVIVRAITRVIVREIGGRSFLDYFGKFSWLLLEALLITA
jgi:hypothetical protein